MNVCMSFCLFINCDGNRASICFNVLFIWKLIASKQKTKKFIKHISNICKL